MRTGILVNDIFELHQPALIDPSHPESPSRLRAIAESFSADPILSLADSLLVEPPASDEILKLAHTERHIRRMAEAYGAQDFRIEEETFISSESERVARIAVASAIGAAERILSGSLQNAFCAIRPPGHHALSDSPMGFCIYNNAALVARYLTEIRGLERVLILDWDVHHGNGTQEILERDPKIYFCSIHGDTQGGFYPGIGGTADEVGIDAGRGSILNIPMAAGSDESDYLNALNERFLPWAINFDPQFIVISAGFDAVNGDPLGNMLLEPSSYIALTELVLDLSKRTQSKGVLSLLEGGYNTDLLAKSCTSHLQTLMQGS